MSVGSAVLGLITPQSITPTPQPTNPDFRFGDEDRVLSITACANGPKIA
jgi:hypothetical protein